ncbi:T9SS type A sorting domain-containing protein [Phaeodactylibacter xiamenensis]|uniref:T9SS type A sorting domain-containing protein n=1 Tax=Phaeodactylibacter xiamenensis TaxID=1524460 RepID=UPI003BAB1494
MENNQCLGDAVFRARSLYRLADPTYRFDNATHCQPNAALRAPKATEPLDFTLFPNPTSGLTVLQFNTPITGRSSVTLYSLQGQPVLQQTAREGAQHILLETAALPGGTYFCRVMGVDGVTVVKKLVKL